jgi:Tfp pilus assembly protein PilV
MKRASLPATVALLIALLVISVGCLHRYHNAACTQRGAAYSARAETLKREAHEKLKIGTKKDAVIRFFAENGIPVTFSRDEASGTIYTTGCAPCAPSGWIRCCAHRVAREDR